MTGRQSDNQRIGGIAANPACHQNVGVNIFAEKILASTFLDKHGILHINYLSNGQTISAEYYSSLMVQ